MPLNLFHEKVNHLLYQSFITRSVEDVVDDISNFTYIADRRIFLKDSAKRNDNTSSYLISTMKRRISTMEVGIPFRLFGNSENDCH